MIKIGIAAACLALAGLDTAGAAGFFLSSTGTPLQGPPYYVATATSTPPGNDANPGTAALPFLTLGAAQTAMRGGSAKTTYIRGGTYVLTSPISLTSADNGETWASYPGENAIISGGQDLTTGWAISDGLNNVYALPGVNWDFRELYVNGVHATRARGPDLSPNYPSTAAGWSWTSTGYTAPNSTIAGYANLTDVEIIQQGGFTMGRCLVAPATTGTNIVMANPCWTNAYTIYQQVTNYPRLPSWIENAYELLVPCGVGCWYHNRANNTLYYKPRAGETMNTVPVVAPRYTDLFDGSGVANLRLSRLTFAYTNNFAPSSGGIGYAGVQAGYSCTHTNNDGCPNLVGLPLQVMRSPVAFSGGNNGVTIDHCAFTHIGGRGLWFAHGSQHVMVSASKFADNAGGGFQWGDITDFAQSSPALQTSDIVFRNNSVDQPFEYTDAMGIFVAYTTTTTFDHNEVFGPTYGGVGQYGWGWGPAAGQTSYSGNHNVTNNYVHNYCLYNDCGGIYTNGNSVLANTVNGNYFKTNVNAGAQGIYLDQGSMYWTVTNNVVDSPVGTLAQFLFINTSDSHNNNVTGNYTTVSGVTDGGVSNTTSPNTPVTTPITTPLAAVTIINNAGIQAGVTPGP